jgi:hypothetical protein
MTAVSTYQQASQAYTSSKARLQRKLQRSNLTAFCLGDESSSRSTAADVTSSKGRRADDAIDNSDLLHCKEHTSSEPESVISVRLCKYCHCAIVVAAIVT